MKSFSETYVEFTLKPIMAYEHLGLKEFGFNWHIKIDFSLAVIYLALHCGGATAKQSKFTNFARYSESVISISD